MLDLRPFHLFLKKNVYLFSNGFSFECYSRFDQSRSHQTLVQMLASLSVVMIVDSTLAQYSEGLKKFGIGSPPTSTEGPPIGWFFSRSGGEGIKVLVCPISTWLYACIWHRFLDACSKFRN